MDKIVFIARHGQTDWNREKRFQGRNDIPLNDTGRVQAEALSNKLRDQGIEKIFSSPRSRASETAQIVNRAVNAPVEIVDDLREISHGIYDGLTINEVEEQHGESIIKWREDRINVSPPEGESIRECAERLIPVYERIITETGDKTILVVSHMVVTKVLLIHILGAPLESFWRFDQGSTALNKIRYTSKGPVIEFLNYTEHIKNIE
ncbi:MAG: histidine phosphatase family protein [Acidobacteria bacterium]|nr:histidine phosphatase family protein [Acidobacteriota bacterium]